MVTYDDVNKAWGGIMLPPITAKASRELFCKLIIRFGKHPDKLPTVLPYWARYKGRRVWANPRRADTRQAANGGLKGLGRMIHDASHVIFEDHHPGKLTHSRLHAALEKAMIEYALRKGWHLSKVAPVPKPKLAGVELRQLKLERTRASIARWESKRRRAETALRKLKLRERGLARHLPD